jgi:hypothetical protein
VNFTEDWTTPHAELWMKHLGHLRGIPDSHAIEIGSFEGKSTIWFLKNILTDERSRPRLCHDFIYVDGYLFSEVESSP